MKPEAVQLIIKYAAILISSPLSIEGTQQEIVRAREKKKLEKLAGQALENLATKALDEVKQALTELYQSTKLSGQDHQETREQFINYVMCFLSPQRLHELNIFYSDIEARYAITRDDFYRNASIARSLLQLEARFYKGEVKLQAGSAVELPAAVKHIYKTKFIPFFQQNSSDDANSLEFKILVANNLFFHTLGIGNVVERNMLPEERKSAEQRAIAICQAIEDFTGAMTLLDRKLQASKNLKSVFLSSMKKVFEILNKAKTGLQTEISEKTSASVGNLFGSLKNSLLASVAGHGDKHRENYKLLMDYANTISKVTNALDYAVVDFDQQIKGYLLIKEVFDCLLDSVIQSIKKVDGAFNNDLEMPIATACENAKQELIQLQKTLGVQLEKEKAEASKLRRHTLAGSALSAQLSVPSSTVSHEQSRAVPAASVSSEGLDKSEKPVVALQRSTSVRGSYRQGGVFNPVIEDKAQQEAPLPASAMTSTAIDTPAPAVAKEIVVNDSPEKSKRVRMERRAVSLSAVEAKKLYFQGFSEGDSKAPNLNPP